MMATDKTSSPFDGIDDAFEPFYDETVSIISSGRSTTVACCVFYGGTDELILDSSVETDRTGLQLVFKRKDWKFIESLSVGDIVFLKCGKKYSIRSVSQDVDLGWKVTAREV